MAVDKNFVVKNGLEVNTDLILANAVTNQVGIATTVTKYTLHVNGGIGATNLSVTGVSTFHQIVLDGTVSAGSTTGSVGQYLKSTGTGVAWDSFPVGRTSTTFTASASQNTFNFTYAVGLVDVFVNGIKLTPVEFTASDGVTIVLSSPCFGGEIVDIHAYSVSGLGVGATGITGLTIQDEGVLIGNPQGVTSINFIGAAITAAASGAGLTISHVDKWGQTSAGISTTLNVGLGTTNPRFSLEVGPIGYGDTALWVNGNARITGILTVGTSSIVLDGNNNTLTVPNLVVTNSTTGVTASGAGVTVRDGGGNLGSASIIDFGDNLSVTFSSGIATITGSAGGGGSSQWVTTASGIHTLSSVGIGTTNPTSALTVKGNTSLENLNVSGISTLSGLVVGLQPMSGGNVNLDGNNLQLSANGIDFGSRGNIVFYQKNSFGNQTEIATLYSDTGNLSIDGILSGAGVTVTGTTFTNQLSVSGVSTFNNTVNFNTNTVNYGTKCSISTSGNDLSINAYKDVYISGTYGGTKITSQPGANLVFVDAVAGDVSLYYQTGPGSSGSEKRLQTLGAGATVTGTTFTNQLSVSGSSTLVGNVGIGTTNATSRLTVKGNTSLETLNVSGVSTFVGSVNFGSALGIGTNSTESLIQSTSSSQFLIRNSVGLINIRSNEINLISDPVGSPEYLLRGFGNGAVELYYDNSKKFETLGAGVTVTGTTFTDQLSVSGVSTFTNNINLNTGNLKVATDGVIKIGNSDQLELYYNGGTGQTIKSTGDLRILTNRLLLNNSANDEQLIEANQNGSVALYYDNSKKFETLGAGVTVTGTTFTDQLSVSGVSTFNGSNNYFSGSIICSTYAGTSRVILTGGTGGNTNLYNGGTSYSDFIFTTFQGGSSREIARINKNGVLSLPYADGGLNVVGVSTFIGNVGIGTTNPASKLTVRGGDISVGVSTAHGVILTSPNGTQYRLIVANDGTLSTTAV